MGDFPIVNFPYLKYNIRDSPTYGIFFYSSLQFLRYAWIWLKTTRQVYIRPQWLFSNVCLCVSPLYRSERPRRSSRECVEKLLVVCEK